MGTRAKPRIIAYGFVVYILTVCQPSVAQAATQQAQTIRVDALIESQRTQVWQESRALAEAYHVEATEYLKQNTVVARWNDWVRQDIIRDPVLLVGLVDIAAHYPGQIQSDLRELQDYLGGFLSPSVRYLGLAGPTADEVRELRAVANAPEFLNLPSVRRYLSMLERMNNQTGSYLGVLEPLIRPPVIERLSHGELIVRIGEKTMPLVEVSAKRGLYHWTKEATAAKFTANGLNQADINWAITKWGEGVVGNGLYVSMDSLDSRYYGTHPVRFETARKLLLVRGRARDWRESGPTERLALRIAGIDGILLNVDPIFQHLAWINLLSSDPIKETKAPSLKEIKADFWNIDGFLLGGFSTAVTITQPNEFKVDGKNFFEMWSEQEVDQLFKRPRPVNTRVFPFKEKDDARKWDLKITYNGYSIGWGDTVSRRQAFKIRLRQLEREGIWETPLVQRLRVVHGGMRCRDLFTVSK